MAQLNCHCATAHRLGAKPAPFPKLFPPDDSYLTIRDEEGRLWLWRVEGETPAPAPQQETKSLD